MRAGSMAGCRAEVMRRIPRACMACSCPSPWRPASAVSWMAATRSVCATLRASDTCSDRPSELGSAMPGSSAQRQYSVGGRGPCTAYAPGTVATFETNPHYKMLYSGPYSACVPCAPSTYADGSGMAACQACAVSSGYMYSPSPGGTTCRRCDYGTRWRRGCFSPGFRHTLAPLVPPPIRLWFVSRMFLINLN